MSHRDGYIITQSPPLPAAAKKWHVVREIDGVTLGAYKDPLDIDRIITKDREMIASLPEGMGYIPPLMPVHPDTVYSVPQDPKDKRAGKPEQEPANDPKTEDSLLPITVPPVNPL